MILRGLHIEHWCCIARLNLVRSYATLRDSEKKIAEQVRVYYARLDEYYNTIRAWKASYKAAAQEYHRDLPVVEVEA